MPNRFFLFFVLLGALHSAEIPTESDWEKVKRRILLSAATTTQARETACEAINDFKNSADAKIIYSCLQTITDLDMLPHAISDISTVPAKERAFLANIWIYIASIKNSKLRDIEIAILNAHVHDKKQLTDWQTYLPSFPRKIWKQKNSKKN